MDSEITHILVKFTTKQEQYGVPGTSISVPNNITAYGLNDVVAEFLKKSSVMAHKEIPAFDFLIGGELLMGNDTVIFLLRKHMKGIEAVVDIEFLERQPPPTPQDSLHHDDWVSTLQCSKDWLLTGCYDNTLHLWDVAGLSKGQGEKAHKLTIPAHKAPVKAVSWVNTEDKLKSFISVSIDQTALIWGWCSEANAVECVCECRGHTQSVECVAVNSLKTRFATGSWDNFVKIWTTGGNEGVLLGDGNGDGPDKKKLKRESKKVKIKSPLMTLAGHTESVSGVVWTEEREMATSSWDHTLRLWDMDIGGVKSQITGNCAYFSIDWSPLNRMLLTGCADRFIRLYDPRSNEGSVVKQKFTSHTQWIPSIKWSKTNSYVFVSGGFDKQVKLWDSRSPNAPLYDMFGHDDKVLAVDWSNSDFIVTGSADCTAKVFSISRNLF